MMQYDELEHEYVEAKFEIQRHHRDFKQISDIVHEVLNRENRTKAGMHNALQKIRNIVG